MDTSSVEPRNPEVATSVSVYFKVVRRTFSDNILERWFPPHSKVLRLDMPATVSVVSEDSSTN